MMEDEKKESGYPCFFQLIYYETFGEYYDCKDCIRNAEIEPQEREE